VDGVWTDETITVLADRPYTRMQIIITANAGAGGEAWFDHFVLN
jgi:hypothetical protein